MLLVVLNQIVLCVCVCVCVGGGVWCVCGGGVVCVWGWCGVCVGGVEVCSNMIVRWNPYIYFDN